MQFQGERAFAPPDSPTIPPSKRGAVLGRSYLAQTTKARGTDGRPWRRGLGLPKFVDPDRPSERAEAPSGSSTNASEGQAWRFSGTREGSNVPEPPSFESVKARRASHRNAGGIRAYDSRWPDRRAPFACVTCVSVTSPIPPTRFPSVTTVNKVATVPAPTLAPKRIPKKRCSAVTTT